MISLIRRWPAPLLAALLVVPGLLRAQADPIQIHVIEGQGAVHGIEDSNAVEPVVEVRDAQGRPVVGIPVTFRAPTVGPSVTFYGATRDVTVVTDEAGVAASTTMVANTEPGQFTIEVEAGAATAQVNQANAHLLPEGPKKKLWGPKIIGLAVAGVTIAIVAIAN